MFFSAKKIGRGIRLIFHNLLANRVIGQKPFELAEKGESEEAFSMMFSRSHVTRFELIPMPTQFIPKPEYTLENWEKDEFQGRQFLNGVNPVMIRVAQELGDFSEEIAEELGKDNLQGLIDEKRLFFVSFDELAELKANPHQALPKILNPGVPQDQPRYFDPAIAVFVLSEDRQNLKPTAIQLDRAPGARVYTRDNSGESEWLFAKAKLQTADSQYHEWVSHLGMTHLGKLNLKLVNYWIYFLFCFITNFVRTTTNFLTATEPHIIAIYNVLKRKNHKLHTFLGPLMKDTLLLNWAARGTLAEFGPESIGDRISSVGVGQFMQLIQMKWRKYDFFESGLDKELASRGFTEDFDMPAYLFREDGMKLWKSFGTFATDFVDELYETDDAVAKDAVVQEWAKETSFADKGAVPGFPESFTDKATLAKALQTIMWMTSGLHAAVNFPQFDFYSFGPNKPLGARASVAEFPTHKSEEEQRAWIFNHYMPTLEVTQEVISISQILTLPSLHTINVLDKNFETVGTDSYAKFKEVLEEIGDGITERNTINKEKGLPLYDYLHPDNVSASIDI